MRPRARAPALLLSLVMSNAALLLACSAGPSEYQRTMTAASERAASGKTDDAAALYRKAALATERHELTVEARYREAWLWKRAGDSDRALASLENLAAERSSSRTPRIWLDIGRLRQDKGDLPGAHAAYRKVLSFPESGLAPRAADALVQSSSAAASRAYGDLLPLAAQSAHLGGFLRLRIAQAQASEGDVRGAIQTAENLAREHPLPTGVYTDDALLLSARLRRTLGDWSGALSVIDAFLAAEEKAALVGSYERPAYAEARWLAADIHQLDRYDPLAAEQVLLDLAHLDATSRLRDDALFRAAWLAQERRDEGAACGRAAELENLDPPSTLTPCAAVVCRKGSNAPPVSRRCQHAVDMARGAPDLGAVSESPP